MQMETVTLLSKFSVLSTEAQQEVLDFLEFLTQKQQKKAQAKILSPFQPVLSFGELAGNFKISADFNEPLEDFKDYM